MERSGGRSTRFGLACSSWNLRVRSSGLPAPLGPSFRVEAFQIGAVAVIDMHHGRSDGPVSGHIGTAGQK